VPLQPQRRVVPLRDEPVANVPDSQAAAVGTADDTVEFSRQAEQLRAKGCRCMLKWENAAAVPLFTAEPAILQCPVHHQEP